jgi:Na+/H+-translocating membrane pyrophosphatase
MKKDTFKGYILTILSTIAFSNVYIFGKAALNEVSLPLFLFYLFLFGFTVNLIIFIFKGGIKAVLKELKRMWWVLPTLGILEIFTATTFYASINAIHEPAVTGFLGNLFPLFTP